MNDPVTAIDTRFSEPGATTTAWDAARSVLESAELFWISTVRADGRPHVTPLVAVWLDGALHFTTGATEQKAINLQHDAHVVLTTGCNGWEEGLDIVVEGDARKVTDVASLERLAEAWARKWDGRWQYKVADGGFQHEGGEVLVYSVSPTKVLAFGKGHFSQTQHRFTGAA